MAEFTDVKKGNHKESKEARFFGKIKMLACSRCRRASSNHQYNGAITVKGQ